MARLNRSAKNVHFFSPTFCSTVRGVGEDGSDAERYLHIAKQH